MPVEHILGNSNLKFEIVVVDNALLMVVLRWFGKSTHRSTSFKGKKTQVSRVRTIWVPVTLEVPRFYF